jgi:hypothetical protein
MFPLAASLLAIAATSLAARDNVFDPAYPRPARHPYRYEIWLRHIQYLPDRKRPFAAIVPKTRQCVDQDWAWRHASNEGADTSRSRTKFPYAGRSLARVNIDARGTMLQQSGCCGITNDGGIQCPRRSSTISFSTP